MTSAVAAAPVEFGCGGGYAALLWLAARGVAARRALPLGPWPWAVIGGSGATAVTLAHLFPLDAALLFSVSLIGALVCATVDARTGFIFDALSCILVAVNGAVAMRTGHFADGVSAALLIGGALGLLYFVTGRRGIGLGDVKLAAALALGFGTQLASVAIGSAFILGAGWALILVGRGIAKRSDALRFGPFIAGGAIVSLSANLAGYRW